MKEELQRKYESYIALRRRKIYDFFFLILIFWFTTFWIFFIIFGGITGFGVWLIIAIILITIAKKYPSPPIQPQENEMFLKTCDTLRNIEFYFEDTKSEIHLERARKKLGELISVIRSIQHVQTSHSTIIQKVVKEPLERLSTNLERRVLPLVRHSDNLKDVKEGYSRLESLSLIFMEPMKIAQNLSRCNEILEKIPEPKILPSIGFWDGLSIFFNAHRNVKDGLVGSLIFIGCGVFCYILISGFEIQKENAVGASVAGFIGLLAIYFRR